MYWFKLYHVVRLAVLRLFYRLLILDTHYVSKPSLGKAANVPELCRLEVQTSSGRVSYIFRRDRRALPRELYPGFITVSTMLVEMQAEASVVLKDESLRDLVVVVTYIDYSEVDYRALADVIFRKYRDVVKQYLEEV